MSIAPTGQPTERVEPLARAWNRFWFQPSDPSTLSVLRILVGLSALAYVYSHSADLVVWFAGDGVLPIETVRQLTGASATDQPTVYRWSYFYLFDSPSLLWIAHAGGLLAAVALTLGYYTRVSCVVALVVVLSYVHRAPMITGLAEPVLTLLLLYLCFAPCGARYSLDAWRRRDDERRGLPCAENCVSATLSSRLMQVHLSAFYLMMGLTKLAGTTWWSGEAVWWLGARTESRLFAWTFLHDYMLLVNLWTHGIVLFELSFGVLVWCQSCRRALLTTAVFMWVSLALLTGMVGFCTLMIIANLCFVSPQTSGAFVAAIRATKPRKC